MRNYGMVLISNGCVRIGGARSQCITASLVVALAGQKVARISSCVDLRVSGSVEVLVIVLLQGAKFWLSIRGVVLCAQRQNERSSQAAPCSSTVLRYHHRPNVPVISRWLSCTECIRFYLPGPEMVLSSNVYSEVFVKYTPYSQHLTPLSASAGMQCELSATVVVVACALLALLKVGVGLSRHFPKCVVLSFVWLESF